MFWLENPGPSDVTMRVSTSERGVYPDAELYETTIAAGQQGRMIGDMDRLATDLEAMF
jgi:hypothetical protein